MEEFTKNEQSKEINANFERQIERKYLFLVEGNVVVSS